MVRKHAAPPPGRSLEVLERQAPLKLVLPTSVSIIGVGGVGSWIAYFLALAGVSRLILWDSDTISRSNLNRLALVGPQHEGLPKSIAMAECLRVLVPQCEVIPLTRWTPEAALELGYAVHAGESHWIVAATDTWQSRKDIAAHALAEGLLYIEASAEGEYGGCTGTPAEFATDDEAAPGYASVPVWVGPCVSSAMMVCSYILHDATPGDESWRLGWSATDQALDFQPPTLRDARRRRSA